MFGLVSRGTTRLSDHAFKIAGLWYQLQNRATFLARNVTPLRPSLFTCKGDVLHHFEYLSHGKAEQIGACKFQPNILRAETKHVSRRDIVLPVDWRLFLGTETLHAAVLIRGVRARTSAANFMLLCHTADSVVENVHIQLHQSLPIPSWSSTVITGPWSMCSISFWIVEPQSSPRFRRMLHLHGAAVSDCSLHSVYCLFKPYEPSGKFSAGGKRCDARRDPAAGTETASV